jgi:hypothetical protein
LALFCLSWRSQDLIARVFNARAHTPFDRFTGNRSSFNGASLRLLAQFGLKQRVGKPAAT